MGKQVTLGLPTLWRRLHKKTGYHSDDIQVIVKSAMAEIRLMFEEGVVDEFQFRNFVYFKLKILKPCRAYDFDTGLNYVAPERYDVIARFDTQFIKTMRKLPIKKPTKKKNG